MPRAASALLLPPLALLALGAAAPPAPSGPHDPDLTLHRTCFGHPRATELRAALPDRVDEMVLLWPRAGHARLDGRCVSVARVTIVDHQGLLLTVSFVFSRSGSRPDPGFVPWYGPPAHEGEPERTRPGPPRAEWVWWPDEGREDAWVVVAGSPSASEEALEGLSGFLAASEAASALLRVVGPP